MIGINSIELNEATMIAVVEHYLNTRLFTTDMLPVKVTGLSKTGNNYIADFKLVDNPAVQKNVKLDIIGA